MGKHYGDKGTIHEKKARAVLDGKAVSTGVRQIAGDGAVTCPNPAHTEDHTSKGGGDRKRY